MPVFLLLDLAPAPFAYQQPLVAAVQQACPAVAVLDIDAGSNELLLHYALKLLREASKAVVLVKAIGQAQGFGNVMPLLEELLQEQEGRLVLLLGEHHRLQRMLQARPQLKYKQVKDEAEALLLAIKSYLA
ncbi:hypothetical protein [Pontibacter chitinilyticus]|uniref:hypothetical protein n=1 Tax=Pontibacter chitinilyticus TaxID=2674989 RepID=UPI00321B839D